MNSRVDKHYSSENIGAGSCGVQYQLLQLRSYDLNLNAEVKLMMNYGCQWLYLPRVAELRIKVFPYNYYTWSDMNCVVVFISVICHMYVMSCFI